MKREQQQQKTGYNPIDHGCLVVFFSFLSDAALPLLCERSLPLCCRYRCCRFPTYYTFLSQQSSAHSRHCIVLPVSSDI